MPAFGNNGIVNINSSTEKTVWNVVDSEGKVIMICNNENQAKAHCLTLSQKMNKKLSVSQGKMRCV